MEYIIFSILLVFISTEVNSMESTGGWENVSTFGSQKENGGQHDPTLMRNNATGVRQAPITQEDGVSSVQSSGKNAGQEREEPGGSSWRSTLSSVGSVVFAPVRTTKKVARRFRTAEHNLRRAVESQDYERAEKILTGNAIIARYDGIESNGVDIFQIGKTQNKSALQIALCNVDKEMVELLLQREHGSIKASIIYDFLFKDARNLRLLEQDKTKKIEILNLLLKKRHKYYDRFGIKGKPFIKLVIDTYCDEIKPCFQRESDLLVRECKEVLNAILPLDNRFCRCEFPCRCQTNNLKLLAKTDQKSGQTALMSVVRNGNSIWLSHLLAVYEQVNDRSTHSGDFAIDQKDLKGRTALWHAVKCLQVKAAKKLLDHGAAKEIDKDNLSLQEYINFRLVLVQKQIDMADKKLKQSEICINDEEINSLPKDKGRYIATEFKLKELQKVFGFNVKGRINSFIDRARNSQK